MIGHPPETDLSLPHSPSGTKASDIGNLAPEMIKIVSAEESPIPGRPLMLVTNEFSGNVVVYLLPFSLPPPSSSSPLPVTSLPPPPPSPKVSFSPVYKASLAAAPNSTTQATGLASITLVNSSYASGYFYATNIKQMTMAHLHSGAVGSNGPAIAWAFNGTYGPISGSIKATFAFNPSVNNVSALLAANLVYFNIHTTAYPSGELRGQLAKN
jgi:hypothetical protein